MNEKNIQTIEPDVSEAVERVEEEKKRARFWKRMGQPRYIALSILVLVLLVFAGI